MLTYILIFTGKDRVVMHERHLPHGHRISQHQNSDPRPRAALPAHPRLPSPPPPLLTPPLRSSSTIRTIPSLRRRQGTSNTRSYYRPRRKRKLRKMRRSYGTRCLCSKVSIIPTSCVPILPSFLCHTSARPCYCLTSKFFFFRLTFCRSNFTNGSSFG